MAKNNGNGALVYLPESTYALLLLSNAGKDYSHRMPIISAATRTMDNVNINSNVVVQSAASPTVQSAEAPCRTETDANTASPTENKNTSTAATSTVAQAATSLHPVTFESVLSNTACIKSVSYNLFSAVIPQCYMTQMNKRDTLSGNSSVMSLHRNRPRMNKWSSKPQSK